jgi:hypothetical protein
MIETRQISELGNHRHRNNQGYAPECLKRLDNWTKTPLSNELTNLTCNPLDTLCAGTYSIDIFLEREPS